MYFRYAVSSDAAGDARALGIATADGLTRPLLGIVGAPNTTASLPPTGSFCEVDDPRVEIVAIAPSRRGHDLTLFVQSSVPDAIEATLTFPLLPVAAAWHGTFLERELVPLGLAGGHIRVPLAPGEFKTVSVDLSALAASPSV